MVKILYNKFDKKQIPTLPRVNFPGRIVVVLSESEANRAVDYLMTKDILGIDTETRPSFRKGSYHQVALLQVAAKDICFLFRLNIIGITDSIVRLLEDKSIPKIGLSLNDDMLMLRHRRAFTSGNFIDLQHVVGDFGIEDRSLQKLYANILGGHIVKRERLSNWEQAVLTERQKLYAATDAWACIMIYEELKRLRLTDDFILETVTEETNNTASTIKE